MKKEANSSKYLYFSAMSVTLASFTAGIVLAWTSPCIPKLNGTVDPDDNPLKRAITKLEECLIASLIAVGATLSPFLAGTMTDGIGRKKSLLYSILPTYVGFVMIAMARKVWHIYVARFLSGLSVGAIFLIVPNYLAELAETHNRGSLCCMFAITLTLGVLFIFSIGPYMTIFGSALTCLIAPNLFLILVSVFVPESPYYLLSKQKEPEAQAMLVKLRQKRHSQVQNELNQITDAICENADKKTNYLELFENARYSKALVIGFGLMTIQKISGINAILFYLQSIFQESRTSLSGEVSSIIVAGVQFLSTLISPLLVDKLGRRFLLFVSAIGTTFSLLCIGFYFYLKQTNISVEHITWLPISSLIVYIITYNVGFGPVSFTIVGEIFPPNIKAAATTLCIALCYFVTFFTTVIFPYFMVIIGIAESFWLLAFFCFVSTLFVYFKIPETKGKSLLEIQQMLDK